MMAVSGDAHLTGLEQSLARPGGNVTGLTYFASDHASKCLELITARDPHGLFEVTNAYSVCPFCE